MATFDLQQIVCLNQQERFADELYLVITNGGGKAVARYDRGDFERRDKIDFPQRQMA